jgi:hypothetical protein
MMLSALTCSGVRSSTEQTRLSSDPAAAPDFRRHPTTRLFLQHYLVSLMAELVVNTWLH